jgi:hypothetical protein
MADQTSLREIASELRRLVASSPLSAEDAAAWQAEASQACDRMAGKFPDVSLPHAVMHYLSDAELRAKDSDYRASQKRMMEAVIGNLERGVVPADREIAIPAVVSGPIFLTVLVGALVLLYRACS